MCLNTCVGCLEPIPDGGILLALGAPWHSPCFVCCHCSKPLEGHPFFQHGDSIYCKEDYNALCGLKCRLCNELIDGAYSHVQSRNETFHPACLVCFHCKVSLQNKTLFCDGSSDAIFCEEHYSENASRCAKCHKFINSSRVVHVREEKYHEECYKTKRPSAIKKVPVIEGEDDDEQDHSDDEDEGGYQKYKDLVDGAQIIPYLVQGMERVLGRKEYFLFRPDYRKKDLYKLERNGDEFDFMDYAPRVFQGIRKLYGITREDFCKSLVQEGIRGGKLGAGKSGMLFFYSNDNRYVIKTLTRAELKFFRKIMSRYYSHMRKHLHSMLPRFLAMFKVTVTGCAPLRIIVMNNLFETPTRLNIQIHGKYDLKGSTRNRYVDVDKDGDGGHGVLKDLNFQSKIFIGAEAKTVVLQQMVKDTQFLMDMNIMDQSLLLGIYRPHNTPTEPKPTPIFAPSLPSSSSIPPADSPRSSTSAASSSSSSPSTASSASTAPAPTTPAPAAGEKSVEEGYEPPIIAGQALLQTADLKGKLLNQEERPDLFSCFQRDYGGLRGVHPETGKACDTIYFLGIIDILQAFNMKKKLESAYKGLKHDKKEISAVDSRMYGKRFLNYMEGHIQ